jgi:hypothetical protein
VPVAPSEDEDDEGEPSTIECSKRREPDGKRMNPEDTGNQGSTQSSMLKTANREIRLASRPSGVPTAANFTLARTELEALQDQEVLVRNIFMSVDPYMRGKTPLRFTPLPRHFRCYPRNCPPILPRSTMNQIALPSPLKWFSPRMDRFGVRISIERWYAIVPSLLTTA